MLKKIFSLFSKKNNLINDIEFDPGVSMFQWQLEGLSISLARTNYSLSMGIIGFTLPTKKPFSFALFQELFAHEKNVYPVAGTLKEVDLKTLQNGIEEIILWPTDGVCSQAAETEAAAIIFWDIVFEALGGHPKQCFFHEPAASSYFGDAPSGWDYCYILVAGKKGVILAGWGSD